MMDRRIRVPKDKDDLLARLTRTEDNPLGPFRLRADAMMFAAAYGFRRASRRSFSTTGEPIRSEVFERQGYVPVINLMALVDTRDPNSLSESDTAVDLRATVFEEYANGGLDLLRQELHGLEDPLGRLLLIVEAERLPQDVEGDQELDLGRFLRG